MGNHAITDLVSSAAFTHTGMSGGAGYDCPNGSGCFNDDSCTTQHCELSLCALRLVTAKRRLPQDTEAQ